MDWRFSTILGNIGLIEAGVRLTYARVPHATQPKPLRVLQERTVCPLGESSEIPVDVRILSATNRDLESAIEDKRFQEDPYFRINVVQIASTTCRARC